ncbi:hypothetical protein VC83_02071 [Pseudogymnoascus destructans]|uniref:Uncharacterized protein n=2 Tax=Pseudogymnoascus destructans TaxID=655981 RepID=L8FTF6_PSED2|nr:uncharacterized protein VC83_02071 [Pseudogymnoascus destructans]ELR04147.1 hypothetical protein GMDG_01451 [Pseudogymnoascus destructans 20631-21]OAF61621.1 hypothetical protein VC83_02071 [Pseudogymnoascus destructans]
MDNDVDAQPGRSTESLGQAVRYRKLAIKKMISDLLPEDRAIMDAYLEKYESEARLRKNKSMKQREYNSIVAGTATVPSAVPDHQAEIGGSSAADAPEANDGHAGAPGTSQQSTLESGVQGMLAVPATINKVGGSPTAPEGTTSPVRRSELVSGELVEDNLGAQDTTLTKDIQKESSSTTTCSMPRTHFQNGSENNIQSSRPILDKNLNLLSLHLQAANGLMGTIADDKHPILQLRLGSDAKRVITAAVKETIDDNMTVLKMRHTSLNSMMNDLKAEVADLKAQNLDLVTAMAGVMAMMKNMEENQTKKATEAVYLTLKHFLAGKTLELRDSGNDDSSVSTELGLEMEKNLPDGFNHKEHIEREKLENPNHYPGLLERMYGEDCNPVTGTAIINTRNGRKGGKKRTGLEMESLGIKKPKTTQ